MKSSSVIRRRGFTLIEVLIAMTLLSIMVVLLFSSLRICAQSWEQGESKITEVNEAAVVYNFFQQHLSSAIPAWNDFTKKEERKLSFQGSKQSLQFVSALPASAGKSGLQLFSIVPVEQDNEWLIKVTLTPFFPVAEGKTWRQEEAILLKHVSDYALAYSSSRTDGVENGWQDEWLAKDTQPRLVKISIKTANSVFWPEMIIELKNSGTAYSPDTGSTPMNGTGQAPAESGD